MTSYFLFPPSQRKRSGSERATFWSLIGHWCETTTVPFGAQYGLEKLKIRMIIGRSNEQNTDWTWSVIVVKNL